MMSGSAMAAARRDFERRRTPRLGTTDAGIFGQTPGFHHNIEFRRCQCLRGKGACPIAHFKRGPSCRGRRPRRPAGTRMGPHNGPSKGPVPPGGFIRRTAPAGPPPSWRTKARLPERPFRTRNVPCRETLLRNRGRPVRTGRAVSEYVQK